MFIKQPFRECISREAVERLCCFCSLRGSPRGDGDMRAYSRNLHDAWPRRAPLCASKDTDVSVYDHMSQWMQRAYKSFVFAKCVCEALFLEKRTHFSPITKSFRKLRQEERITKEWGPGNAELEGG